eukprot:10619549-Alexandrium_andersonii.AAC.1
MCIRDSISELPSLLPELALLALLVALASPLAAPLRPDVSVVVVRLASGGSVCGSLRLRNFVLLELSLSLHDRH